MLTMLYINSMTIKVNQNKIIGEKDKKEEKAKKEEKEEEPKTDYLRNPTFLTAGYNILLGNPQITPKSGSLMDPGFASEIFKTTYEQKQVTGDFTFYVPDGYSLKVTQICQANFSSQTVRTRTDLSKTLQASLGVSGSYGAYSGSLNTEYRDMSKSMDESDKMFIVNQAECSIYRTHVNQYSPPPFSDEFISGLKSINGKTWESDSEAYRTFFDSFGTHYIKNTLMGSRYTYTLETTNSKFNSLVEKGFNIAAQAEYSAMFSLSAKASSEVKGDKSKNEEFEKNMTNKYVTSIGAPMPGSLEMADWFEKTNEKPMPISYFLSPISQLFRIPTVVTKLTAEGLVPNSLISGLDGAFKGIVKDIADFNKANGIVSPTSSAISSGYKTYNTNFDDDGQGNVVFLDRHPISCPDHEALSNWRLVRGDRTIKYEYKCIRSATISKTCTEYNTDPQDAGNAAFMDRHTVNCPSGVLKGFHFVRNGNKMFFKFNCCNLTIPLKCNQIETAKTAAGDHKTYFLDRINFNIPDEKAVSGFKFNSDGTNYSYSLKVCDVQEQNNYTPDPISGPISGPTVVALKSEVHVRRVNTPQFDSGRGNIFYLDRADVNCGDNEGISQFKLNRSGNNFFYEYACAKSDKITNECTPKKTDHNDVSNNHESSAHFLDRHDMNCEKNNVIRRFKLGRSGNRIYYDYLCCKTRNTETCNDRTTGGSDKGDHSTYYLDRQSVIAEAFTAFSRIKLNNGNQFSYTTTQCFVN